MLPAPQRPEEADVVGHAELAAVLDAARSAYDAVVIDTGPLFDGAMLAALDHTDQLLLVCNPEVTSLKNVRIGLETIDRLGFDRANGLARREPHRRRRRRRPSPTSSSRSTRRSRTSCPTIPPSRPPSTARCPIVLADESSPFSRALGGAAAVRRSRASTQSREATPRTTHSAASCCEAGDERSSTATDSRAAPTPRSSPSASGVDRSIGAGQRARDPHAELKTRIHRTCIARLGNAFLSLEGTDELARAGCATSSPTS